MPSTSSETSDPERPNTAGNNAIQRVRDRRIDLFVEPLATGLVLAIASAGRAELGASTGTFVCAARSVDACRGEVCTAQNDSTECRR